MPVLRILMRLVEPREKGQSLQGSTIAPAVPCLDVEATYTLSADDSQSPSTNTLYFVSDISPILSTPSACNEDVQVHGSELASISWIVCAFINGRDSSASKSALRSLNALPAPPADGSIVVVNGATPRPDKEQDYHDWYDQEHGEKLTLVPGWNSARRYRLTKLYGEAETANFYGINYYDEENGLGGPEWQAGVTDWTLRIRSNAAKPNIRRVWKAARTKDA